jgi:adenine-specific DNA-methyltransferase
MVNIDMPKSPAVAKKLAPSPRRKTPRVREAEQLYLGRNGNGAKDEVLLPHNPLPKAFFSSRIPNQFPDNFIYRGSCENFLWHAKRQKKKFDLIFTSPPYNLGKAYSDYSDDRDLDEYLEWQEAVIKDCIECLSEFGSICWQVGNYVNNGLVVPLDLELHPIFTGANLKLRNRVVWHFGHGLHCNRRFSGRYEVVLWYTKSEDYKFNLDPVRVPSKYPNKKHFKGPKRGQLSSNPLGKNPSDVWDDDDHAIEDVWDIPNVKHNHPEKLGHPCQFPIGLVTRFIRALTDEGDSVFDPFLGVGTTAAAAAMWKRRYWGCELNKHYFASARNRIELAANGLLQFRDPDKPIYKPPSAVRSVATS